MAILQKPHRGHKPVSGIQVSAVNNRMLQDSRFQALFPPAYDKHLIWCDDCNSQAVAKHLIRLNRALHWHILVLRPHPEFTYSGQDSSKENTAGERVLRVRISEQLWIIPEIRLMKIVPHGADHFQQVRH